MSYSSEAAGLVYASVTYQGFHWTICKKMCLFIKKKVIKKKNSFNRPHTHSYKKKVTLRHLIWHSRALVDWQTHRRQLRVRYLAQWCFNMQEQGIKPGLDPLIFQLKETALPQLLYEMTLLNLLTNLIQYWICCASASCFATTDSKTHGHSFWVRKMKPVRKHINPAFYLQATRWW